MTATPRRFITRVEVAELLGIRATCEDTIRRKLADLVRDHGFPPPAPGLQPHRWDPAAVAAWQDDQIPPRLRHADRVTVGGGGTADIDDDAWRSIMARLEAETPEQEGVE